MIDVVFEADRQQATAYDGHKEIGYASYRPTGKSWNLNHTVVDPQYGGQGIAALLVDAVVQAAREEGMKILPTCSYAVKKFREKEEYKDVLAN